MGIVARTEVLTVVYTNERGYVERAQRGVLPEPPATGRGYTVYRGILHSVVFDESSRKPALALLDGEALWYGNVPQKIQYDVLKLNKFNGKSVRVPS